jgi:hypothetical protein
MKTRIEILAEQATEIDPNALEGAVGPGVFNQEKFAELLVRECSEVGAYYGGNVRYLILNNFGLKP